MAECKHEWGEWEDREWQEAGLIRATVRECKICGKIEFQRGVIYYPEGGIYELLPPDGNIGGALCATGW